MRRAPLPAVRVNLSFDTFPLCPTSPWAWVALTASGAVVERIAGKSELIEPLVVEASRWKDRSEESVTASTSSACHRWPRLRGARFSSLVIQLAHPDHLTFPH